MLVYIKCNLRLHVRITKKLFVFVVWKGIHSRSNTNRTGTKSLSFYYPRLLYCQDQRLAVMLVSQHRVSSSKTVRPCAPCGARCMGHAIRTWFAVCSETAHLQFGHKARPHLCMDEYNLPTPVRRRLSLPKLIGAARFNTPGTGPRYKNTKFRCILTVLRVPFMIRPLRNANVKSVKVV